MDENKYQKLYTSAALAMVDLEKKLNECRTKILLLEAEKKQWEFEKVHQQVIIQQAINNANATNNEYLSEINQLRKEIATLKGE